jgi:diacylglycerol kinase
MMPDGRHPRFFESFRYALAGLADAVRGERNFKVMLAGGVLAVALGLLLRIDAAGWVGVVLCIAAVLSCELLNTALETVVDLVCPERDPRAKRAKDLGAAASLVVSLAALAVGVLVYVRAALLLWG